MGKIKNRDIPITEYLDILQHEYIIAGLRHKIYPKISDRAFWEKVMNGKKKKIEDICFRNKIDSIFTSEEELRRIYGLVYNESGLPNFLYKDDEQRFGIEGYPGLEETDIENYYSLGSDVRIDEPDEERILGKITGYTKNRKQIKVNTNEGEFIVFAEHVTRIL
jgi:hypothetical protein